MNTVWLPLLAQDDGGGPWLNPQFILMAVAGLIYVITQIVSVVREHQKRVAREQAKRETATSVVFEDRNRGDDLLPPPGLPEEAAEIGPTPAQAKLRLGRVVGRPLQKTMQDRLVRSRPDAARFPAKKKPIQGAESLLEALRGKPERIRDAVLFREILGPPLALRSRTRMDRRD